MGRGVGVMGVGVMCRGVGGWGYVRGLWGEAFIRRDRRVSVGIRLRYGEPRVRGGARV